MIPTIDLDANVESTGITGAGAMGIPKNPQNVAWYELGPHPGEEGSAVIDGHVNWENGAPAVFTNLHLLVVGDKVLIEDSDGVTLSFVVTRIATYNFDTYDPEIFISNDGKARLNLITCIGIWDKVSKNYSERLVIFTEKES